MLQNNQIDRRKVGGAIIASVVPKVMHALIGAVVRYLHTEPLIVGSGIKTGIKITSENPKEIGPDRIVDVVAAYEKYGGPVLVLDFGTATTYDLVTEDGRFGVGITAPGIRISAKALWEDTARLPEVEIKKPDSILARETISTRLSAERQACKSAERRYGSRSKSGISLYRYGTAFRKMRR